MDIRVTKTRAGIINAFLELRSRKAIEKISVKELCEKAMINKSTFYAHYTDIYDLSEQLETRLANDVLGSMESLDHVFTDPVRFYTNLFYAFLSQEHLIRILFSGSRSGMLIVRIEEGVRSYVFGRYPELTDDPRLNVILTYGIYGGYYALVNCRRFGEAEVIGLLAQLNGKITELAELP